MKLTTTIGICQMDVDVELRRENSINYLVFEFLQRTDTAGITSITINAPSKKEILKLAKNLKQIGDKMPD